MKRFAVAALVSAMIAPAPPVHAAHTDVLRGKVVAYTSATAFAVLDPSEKLRRIKLTGIDAPERKQKYATEARLLASQWLSTKPIDITVDAVDHDARIIGRVVVDGRDVGLALIEAGLAWCDPGDAALLPAPLADTYRTACEQAKAQRRGLWLDAHPVAPWDYRKIPEFDAPRPSQAPPRHCQDVGYQSVQCDDGKRYRAVGNDIIGSDGTVYARRGNTYTSDDGTRYTQQGQSTYGSDGTVCRSRGRHTSCHTSCY